MNFAPTTQDLIGFIWSIANLLRGPYRPPQYRRVMLPLTVLRRLDCVLEPTKEKVLAEHVALKGRKLDESTIERTIKHKFKLPLFNTSKFTFKKLLDDPDKIAFNLVAYLKGFSSDARRILEHFDFEAEIQKLDQANRLFEVIKQFNEIGLHPDRVSNIQMGLVFEDLVRRFNEQANEEAGDHFTPREVIRLMVHLLFTPDDDVFTKQGLARTLYDPCCGTGGMLSVADEYVREHAPGLHFLVYGQEYNDEAYAVCGSDLLIKGEDPANVVFGDTLGNGKSGDGHPDRKFHYLLANPPFGVEWKTQQEFITKEHETLGFNGRFGPGLPRISDGSLLFLLHMISKMQPAEDGGCRIGIVFNGSPLFTGDSGSGESNIRRWIVENDWLDAIVALPDQMFYNTGIFTYVWIVTNRKEKARRGKVQLIDGTALFRKMRKSLGNKRNEMAPEHIGEVTRLYADFQAGERSKIFRNQDFGYVRITVERPLRLAFQVTPERIARVQELSGFQGLAESKKRKDKASAAKEIAAGRTQQAAILAALGTIDPAKVWRDRAQFAPVIEAALDKAGAEIAPALHRAIVLALGERDEAAEVCHKGDAPGGAIEPDTDLRDTENVPLPADCPLPLPIDYGDKVDNEKLIAQVRKACEAYFEREVRPHVPDAWIDWSRTKVGYEIPFTRHFYKYQPPRPLDEIEADLRKLEGEIVALLGVVAQ